ncbi:hypothetical protein EB796_004781 [Bugula neritina]|uniref:Uncharacterized protein n=1 Tax=Bugula neritina TaxID=10212 RepID=A0A7J7KFC2_BUGNE|nr:hypothetical protein EB796_004781 [Bugula neritina]
MNQEVRKAEAELNKALSECEEKLKAAKKHSQNINEMLCQTSQEFEDLENRSEVLLKNQILLTDEENNITSIAAEKEKVVADLQAQLLATLEIEKKQHVPLFDNLMRSLKDILKLKQNSANYKLV